MKKIKHSIFIVLLFFTFSNLCYSNNDKGKIVDFESLETVVLDKNGQTVSFNPPLGFVIIRSESEWKSLWSRPNSDSIPKIDFQQFMVISVVQGRMPGMGNIKVEKIIETKTQFIIHIKRISPGPNCPTLAITIFPMHVIKTKNTYKEKVFATENIVTSCP